MKKTPIIVIIAALCFNALVHADNSTYVIKKGDTLYGISKKYNITMDSLKKNNEITDPSKIFPGMTLIIPGGYTVKKGDTLYGIARQYHLSMDELALQNNMKTTDVLYPGQLLSVPGIEISDAANEIDSEIAETSADASASETKSATEDSQGDNRESDGDVAAGEESDFYWPHYGNRSELTGKLKGIQIKGTPGDEITSVSGGTVVWASEYGIYKELVLVESMDGIMYGYGGNDKSIVHVGDSVKAGSVIGFLGGLQDESDAYFFVYKDGKPLDPVKAPRVF